MNRIALPVMFFAIVIALNSWGAERRRLNPPIMSPDFPQSPFGFTKGDPQRGKWVYQRNSCSACHTIGGRGGKIGPDLSRVGEVRTIPAWYRQHLVNTHKPPAILADQDMDDLIAYLQSLKLFR
ncbi:MAG: c-type cytochrome [Nitrospinota bacterium]